LSAMENPFPLTTDVYASPIRNHDTARGRGEALGARAVKTYVKTQEPYAYTA